ncbi:alpha/beta hydrolase [Subtercola lobariae]|uniref:Alpha/beta hydrolase n=1 Tax=Subtercola lobariae TaxID=1588641 RepID=A0A917B2R6_9MICO|nr:alpha/beta hydrolase [Subtercola lobariae]GGF16190.1 alpha/beta hydrolase [Subtercola lobariae]
MSYIEADAHPEIFIDHGYEEHIVDLGEIRMNYAVAGDPSLPPLLLIPSQSESWWGYEGAMALLAERFQVFAVDLRGQGRSTWTPGRYTLDIFGSDLVHFIDEVIGRPTYISGLSSGGTIAAWLSAFAKPGQIIAAVWEDAPFFSSEVTPAIGQGIRQGIGVTFTMWNKYLGDQWSIGDFEGMQRAMPKAVPLSTLKALGRMFPRPEGHELPPGVPQNLKEYDPEWGKAFVSGVATASCDHQNMILNNKVPVLITHHFHFVDEQTGQLTGAMSDLQAQRVTELARETGQPVTFLSFPEMGHAMHRVDPKLYADTVVTFVDGLGAE